MESWAAEKGGMKGQEISLNLIGYLVIAVVGILVLLLFIQGPLQSILKSTFCYFYQKVLQQTSGLCSKPEDQPGFVDVSADTPKNLAEYIIAYSIDCWNKRNPEIQKDIVCNTLFLKKNPGNVTELLLTQVMEKEGACVSLPNSEIVDQNGNKFPYSGNCGSEDDIIWNVDGYVINQQSIVLIKYDISSAKIEIKA